jgi:hypothetical protein
LIFLITFSFVALYANAETLHDNIECNSSSIFEQNKLLKKELENGNIIYRSKELNIDVISHATISDTDKDYVDYIFFTKSQNLGHIRFYDVDSFTDSGNAYLFVNVHSKYLLAEYLDENLERYYFIVDLTNPKISKIFEHKYGDKYSSFKYTPKKILEQDKHLPVSYNLFEKDGRLYLKVGSTYKSDIITLKKPANGK